jgi:hypothetical protein
MAADSLPTIALIDNFDETLSNIQGFFGFIQVTGKNIDEFSHTNRVALGS